MSRLLTVAAMVSLVSAHWAMAGSQPQQSGPAQPAPAVETASSDGLPSLPPAPHGKPTLIGGEIARIDPVRDQFVLDVPGARPIKLLFDARTKVFRDGVPLEPGDLQTGNRASVETVLDGTKVFALSIHMLTRPPDGECHGQVVKYDSRSRELTVSSALTHGPIKLLVPPGTPVNAQGQAASSPSLPDLVPGTLVSVQFAPDNLGHGVASQVTVLATPGATFVFEGNIASIDVHAGRLVLEDVPADKSYQLSFDPAQFPLSHNLHPGERVKVTASFDGARYVASAIDAG